MYCVYTWKCIHMLTHNLAGIHRPQQLPNLQALHTIFTGEWQTPWHLSARAPMRLPWTLRSSGIHECQYLRLKEPNTTNTANITTAITGMINTEGRREEALEDMRESDQKVSAAAYRELVVTDLRPELSKITAPTEVLYVKFNDPRMTPELTDTIYRMSYANLPGATLKRIDDSAHFIMFDQPQAFHAELDAFLSAE